MYIRNYMTSNPYTITPDETIADALELMRAKRIKRMPVVKDGSIAGIITERKLLEVSPSPATTLSIFEINYLLAKTKIETVMIKDFLCLAPDDLLEVAAAMMRENDDGCILVVDQEKLVGIITETDVFNAFIEIVGFEDKGSRISVSINDDKPGVLAKVAGIIAKFDINISHMVLFRNEFIIRVNSLNIDAVAEALESNGLKVLSVYKND